MAYRKDWLQPQTGGQGFARTMKTIGRVVNVSATDDVTGNTVGAFTVPPGFTVTSIIVISSTFAAGLAFTVGDAGSGNRYLTTGVANATNVTLATTGLLFKNTAETEIIVTIGTQASGNVVGTISVYITGFIDN